MLVSLKTDCDITVNIKTVTQSVDVEKGDVSLGLSINSGVH